MNQKYQLGDENTVQCLFFCFSLDSNLNSWHNLCENINRNIEYLSQGYLWQKDAFKVFLPINEHNNKEVPTHLISNTCFGDNIEDEWFIVYIVLELTKRYKDIMVQIKDSDGEFLLIEAADYLPQWANPETTENRLFIYNKHIHLISPHLASLDETLALKDAVQIVLNASNQTQVSQVLEQAIINRIGNYPDKIKENHHYAIVEIPLEIAALLKLNPNLIAPIVDTYCHHDDIDAKTCKHIPYDDWIPVKIKFTKCLYAMLLHSKLINSKRQSITKDKKKILGIKLTYGYQMIVKKSSDIYSSKEYYQFLHSLKENGYFKNNIEGSKEYKKLLENAKEFFSAVECSPASNVANIISQIITSNEYMEVKELVRNESLATANLEEDNDDWLTIHPDQLNDLLNSRYGKKNKFNKGDVITPETITNELKDFLKQTSDFEGIETSNKVSENYIDFDSDQFMNSIEKMLKILSNNHDKDEIESLESDLSNDAISDSEDDNELDKELKENLHGAGANLNDKKSILENMISSMKEEKATMGPSSSLMSNLGLNKADLLDSDDDC